MLSFPPGFPFLMLGFSDEDPLLPRNFPGTRWLRSGSQSGEKDLHIHP